MAPTSDPTAFQGSAIENEPTNNKIDPITQLQDAIDGLSLAMFEALRSLRDAVAPESGNLGAGGGSNNQEAAGGESPPDMEELWSLYRSGDKQTVADFTKVAKGPITRREDFIRFHSMMEMEKDRELVNKLASTVLSKSAEIDDMVDGLIGMNRNRREQMARIEEMVEANRVAAEELETSYKIAMERRDACRSFIRSRTGEALGIEEES